MYTQTTTEQNLKSSGIECQCTRPNSTCGLCRTEEENIAFYEEKEREMFDDVDGMDNEEN